MSDLVHHITVDHSERRSALLDAVRRTGEFQVRMTHLTTGDYLIGNDVLVERKSVADLAASLVDGRLFPQVTRPHWVRSEVSVPRRRPVSGNLLGDVANGFIGRLPHPEHATRQ